MKSLKLSRLAATTTDAVVFKQMLRIQEEKEHSARAAYRNLHLKTYRLLHEKDSVHREFFDARIVVCHEPFMAESRCPSGPQLYVRWHVHCHHVQSERAQDWTLI